MMVLFYLIGVVISVTLSLIIYYSCNKGMARNAKGQQTRRMIIASALAMLPLLAPQSESIRWHQLLMIIVSSGLWMLTYPLLFHLSNRKSSPDYEHYGDISCGIYLAGLWLSLILLGVPFVAALIQWIMLIICVVQWGYFFLYRLCIDNNGMKIIQDTHYNEIIEFIKSYPWWVSVAVCLAILLMLVGVIVFNGVIQLPFVWWMVFPAVFYAYYIFKWPRGMFVRSGIVALWLVIKEFSAGNMRYKSGMQERLKDLQVEPLGIPDSCPITLLMVIGESASRDYMSAFTPMEHDTTPWMRALAQDEDHTILFKHAYSCAMHTVQVLEKSLTEYNQYNDKIFYESCSIVDIAHQLGFKVHWYSNQGHLGAADTPITLVAETSDVAKWTKQNLGKVQYDHTLIDFLDEVNPNCNNLVVMHLKGSHFNFLNRYPEEYTVWGKPGVQDNILNYENSLHYTDGVIQQFYDYCKDKLNLQAMVYFSDHATIPDVHRSPGFGGFGNTRIPLLVWMNETYKQHHIDRWNALKANKDRYFTNDLIYNLMCGVMDVRSNHYDERDSLASLQYKYQRGDLLTYEKQRRIIEDTDEEDNSRQ